jgi:hypothetical protein
MVVLMIVVCAVIIAYMMKITIDKGCDHNEKQNTRERASGNVGNYA